MGNKIITETETMINTGAEAETDSNKCKYKIRMEIKTTRKGPRKRQEKSQGKLP